MECFTRVKHACVYFNGTKSEISAKATHSTKSEKFIDRKLSRPSYFLRKNDIVKHENWFQNFVSKLLCCNRDGNSRDGTQLDFGDFEMLDEEYG